MDSDKEILQDVQAEDDERHDNLKIGAQQDAIDMRRLGKPQELRRNFKALSILGLATVTMATWVAMITNSLFSLINGGLAGTIWVYLGSWLLTVCLVSSLAEMASMAPTSGGQYHWVSEFAPPSQQKFLSYCVGWLSALGWQALIAATVYASSVLVFELTALNNSNFTYGRWHVTLLMIGIGLFGTLFNTFGAKRLPLLEGVVLCVLIFGFFCIIVPLWVLAPKASAGEVFTQFSNFGGWPSIGTACLVGQLTAISAFAGSDAPAHLAEEVKNASLAVPRMMLATILLNGAMGFVVIITYVFCITDIEAVVGSTSVFPFVDVFYAATASRSGATAMACIPLVLTACTSLNAMAAASRQAWSLARDGGLPFASWFRKVVTIGTPIPLNAILFSLSILVVLSLINIGSSTAFNSIVGLLTSANSFSYAASIGCVLSRRIRGQPLPHARWSLGKWGLPINIVSVLYAILTAIISFFPLVTPVTVQGMNWSIVMFAGVFAIAATDYMLRGRHRYTGPVVHIRKD
ncbi:Putative amino acid/polyamine transporter I [Septoria linicola]|uniref:Amino acid/polyamine transporter I n=1 Tax=Septoria linicola TaxID=215465 RepID=A0A9Q9EMT9_9PEZI|nr:putative amino acid/polyamine transporter I [Septoria linicola]USW55829.1 Putative amino acid/polyamine transporter I [Septoria linicola]